MKIIYIVLWQIKLATAHLDVNSYSFQARNTWKWVLPKNINSITRSVLNLAVPGQSTSALEENVLGNHSRDGMFQGLILSVTSDEAQLQNYILHSFRTSVKKKKLSPSSIPHEHNTKLKHHQAIKKFQMTGISLLKSQHTVINQINRIHLHKKKHQVLNFTHPLTLASKSTGKSGNE